MSGSLPFGAGPFGAGPWPSYRIVTPTRPYGVGPYGTSVYSTYATHSIGGVAQIACGAQGTMVRTWQQPTGMCATGTWTLTSLPSGPVNDQLELA